jgi:hypothetical protein
MEAMNTARRQRKVVIETDLSPLMGQGPAKKKKRKPLLKMPQEEGGAAVARKPERLAPRSESDRMILTLDGDFPQINLLAQDEWEATLDASSTELLKFPAACSGALQMNDVSSGFRVLKSLLRGTLDYKEYGNFSPPVYMNDLTTLLNTRTGLATSKKKLILEFFKHAQAILHKAFNPAAIKKSYKKSGFYPFNAEQIMSQCTEWKSMEPEKKRAMLAEIPKLTNVALEAGKLLEKDLERAHIGRDPDEKITKTPLDEKHASYQRTLWLNHRKYSEERRERNAELARQAEEKAQQKVGKKKAAAAKKQAAAAKKLAAAQKREEAAQKRAQKRAAKEQKQAASRQQKAKAKAAVAAAQRASARAAAAQQKKAGRKRKRAPAPNDENVPPPSSSSSAPSASAKPPHQQLRVVVTSRRARPIKPPQRLGD